MANEKTTSERGYRICPTEQKSCWLLWCTACARLVNMAALDHAALLTGLPIETLVERLNRRNVHALKKQSGNLLVCLDSLVAVLPPTRADRVPLSHG